MTTNEMLIAAVLKERMAYAEEANLQGWKKYNPARAKVSARSFFYRYLKEMLSRLTAKPQVSQQDCCCAC